MSPKIPRLTPTTLRISRQIKTCIEDRFESLAADGKQESELRRTQTENLIDFILVELRDKLAPIGQLKVLDSVDDKALEYFAALVVTGDPKKCLLGPFRLDKLVKYVLTN